MLLCKKSHISPAPTQSFPDFPSSQPQGPGSLELPQDLGQEVLEAEGDVAVAVVVVLLEDVGHALEADAGLHKKVEAEDALVALVVGLEEQLDEALRQAVAEGDEGVVELVELDVAALVGVEAVEQGAPRRQERPQPAELLEPDRPAAVAVEHPDHHAHRVRVEGGPVPVDEGRRELALRELAGAWCGWVVLLAFLSLFPGAPPRLSPEPVMGVIRTILVNSSEERQQRRVGPAFSRRRARRGSRVGRWSVMLGRGPWAAGGRWRHDARVGVVMSS